MKNLISITTYATIVLIASICNAQSPEKVEDAFIELKGNQIVRETFLFADTNFVYYEKEGEHFKIPQSDIVNSIGIKTIPTTNYYQDMYKAGKIGTNAAFLQLAGISMGFLGYALFKHDPNNNITATFIGTGTVMTITGILFTIGAWSNLKEANMKMAAKVVQY